MAEIDLKNFENEYPHPENDIKFNDNINIRLSKQGALWINNKNSEYAGWGLGMETNYKEGTIVSMALSDIFRNFKDYNFDANEEPFSIIV